MSVIRGLSRVAMLPAVPVLVAQGRRLRRDTLRLPDAARPWQGSVDGPEPLHLLVLGDSTAAGVGATTQHDALGCNLARKLAERTGRGVTWSAVGRNGALGLRSRAAFARDIHTLLTALTGVSPFVLMSSLPAFFRFELLPNPLRSNFYLHSRSLEDAARAVVATFPTVHMSPPPPPDTAGAL